MTDKTDPKEQEATPIIEDKPAPDADDEGEWTRKELERRWPFRTTRARNFPRTK